MHNDHNTSEAEQIIGCAEVYYFRVKPKSNNKVSLKAKREQHYREQNVKSFFKGKCVSSIEIESFM